MDFFLVILVVVASFLAGGAALAALLGWVIMRAVKASILDARLHRDSGVDELGESTSSSAQDPPRGGE